MTCRPYENKNYNQLSNLYKIFLLLSLFLRRSSILKTYLKYILLIDSCICELQ